jgi:coproporphyrinogen III oxidase
MVLTFGGAKDAASALAMVKGLQSHFKAGLLPLCEKFSCGPYFQSATWLRQDGRHGGGERFFAVENQLMNRGSINVSQVHYEDEPSKSLESATALSAIIHPENPHAPSVHLHISWTKMKKRPGTWRLMADLNPAIPKPRDTEEFSSTLAQCCPDLYGLGTAQGDQYFFIPILDRHRGVCHFYLEEFYTKDQTLDLNLAQTFGQSMIDCYCEILQRACLHNAEASPQDYNAQRSYHSLYFLQVLTLDRGTTSGLLVHDENDTGIMGSLPALVDKSLLESWVTLQPKPQDQLLKNLLSELPDMDPCPVDDSTKTKLAGVVRAHYKKHPEALNLQAQSPNRVT